MLYFVFLADVIIGWCGVFCLFFLVDGFLRKIFAAEKKVAEKKERLRLQLR